MWSKLLKSLAIGLICATLLLLPGHSAAARDFALRAGAVGADLPTEESGEGKIAPVPAAPAEKEGLRLRTGSGHQTYLRGYEDGTFHPGGYVTRAEEAQILYNLLEKRPADRAELADVDESDWYYDAVSLLAAFGIIDPDENGDVWPDAQLTRAQFVIMLTRLFPELPEAECAFSDLPASVPWYSAVAKATAAGWIRGYEDGTFRAAERITRAEAAAVINRALGRSADRETLDAEVVIPLYRDLKADHWAYAEIMEATVPHTAVEDGEGERWISVSNPKRYAPGPVLAEGELYYAGEDGRLLRSTSAGTLTFGSDGRYTSGDEEIDGYVKGVLAALVTPDMSREEMLRAAYNYTRDSFTYLRRNYYETGDTGWELEECRTMFRTQKGNCYNYTGVFLYLSRQLGYDAVPISGEVGHRLSPHGWVEIRFDGVPYIFDTELEMAYRAKGTYGYDFYMMSYDAVPWPYQK